jgi:hypothetical protein
LAAIGCDLENLAASPGGQNRGFRQNPNEFAFLLPENDATHTLAVIKEKLGGNTLINKRNVPL